MTLSSVNTFNSLVVKPLTWQSAYKYAKGDYDLSRVSEAALQALRDGREFQLSRRDKFNKVVVTFILCIPVINVLAMAIILNKRSKSYQSHLEKSVQELREALLIQEKQKLNREYVNRKERIEKRSDISEQEKKRQLRNLDSELDPSGLTLDDIFKEDIENNLLGIRENIVFLFPEKKDITEEQVKNDILKVYVLQIQREQRKKKKMELDLERRYPIPENFAERKMAIMQKANERLQQNTEHETVNLVVRIWRGFIHYLLHL